jgi:dTDP-4-dehydrorhamnose reductase
VAARRVAVTGSAGQLGSQLVRAFRDAGDDVLAMSRPEWDIQKGADLSRLSAWRPDVVVNAAAWTDVDGCARDPRRAFEINGVAAGNVAAAAATAGALSIQVSTNEVFDGTAQDEYAEDDVPSPVNPYGESKLRGEELARAENPRSIIVRTAWLFGPGGNNFVTKILAAARRAYADGMPLRVVADEWGNPTWTPSLAADIAELTRRNAPGTYHLAGDPPTSRFAWARTFLGPDVTMESIALADYPRASRMPPHAILSTAKVVALGLPRRPWEADSLKLARGEDS